MTAAKSAPRLEGLPPVVSRGTRLLILGSFPGEASLRAQQYYGHPRNHFWPLVGAIWRVDLQPMPYAQRLDLLRVRGLGLWDVYASCRREGSLDQAIREAQFNDLDSLLRLAPGLRLVAHNGGESARAMQRVQALGLPVLRLPSSSPANARWTFDAKLAAWRAAFEQAGI
jgi:hypoxanthine-DNA glycosylase